MSAATGFSLIALLLAGLSAIYAKRAVDQASKANDLGRLNMLFAFRVHYLDLMDKKHRAAIAFRSENLHGGADAADDAYAEIDAKLREVNQKIDRYHEKVVA